MIRRAAALLVAVGIAVLMGGGMSWATQPDPEHKVGLCHRTASDTNPYVYVEVDEVSLSPGHLDNADPGHKPTTWKSAGTWRGDEHAAGDPKDDYLATSADDCDDLVTEPSPTPTDPEPSSSPTPTTSDPEPEPSESGGSTSDPKPTPKADEPRDEPGKVKAPETLPRTGADWQLVALATALLASGGVLYGVTRDR